MAAVRHTCRDAVQGALTGTASSGVAGEDLVRDDVVGLADGELAAYLQMRTDVVTTLVAELVAAPGDGTRFCFQDPTGSVKGYATGDPHGTPGVEAGWQFGVDAASIAEAVHDYRVLGYVRDAARLDLEVRAVRERLGDTRLGCVLRPSPPDSWDAENLAAKLGVLSSLSIDDVGFYHYGLLPGSRLDMLSDALHGR
ncbi:MAG: hypothetical protein ACRDQF_16770 [Thermocrispum sp.]